MRSILSRVLIAVLALSPAASLADSQSDADSFCTRAGRNGLIFEMFAGPTSAKPGKTPGAFICTWTFTRNNGDSMLVTLDSKLLASETAARQVILMGRLPLNERDRAGRYYEKVAPLQLGDDGLWRSAYQDDRLVQLEYEVVKGRRHFLMVVRPIGGPEVPYPAIRAAPSFLGAGIRDL